MTNLKKIFLPHDTDMTKGRIKIKLLLFTIPLIINSFLQILFSGIDSLILAQFGGGKDVVAAVGNSLSLMNTYVLFFTGFSGAASVLFANAFGKKDEDKLQNLLQTSFVLALIIGIIGTIIALSCAKYFLIAMNTPQDIIDISVIHFRFYFVVFIFLMIMNFSLALLQGLGDSKHIMYALILRYVTELIFTCILVIGCNMSVVGVGIAMMLGVIVHCCYAFISVFKRRDKRFQFSLKIFKIHKNELISILTLGLLFGASRFFISFGNTALQSDISLYGTDIIAGSSAAGIFTSLMLNVVEAMAVGCMIAVSQNFAIKNKNNIKICVCYTILYMLVLVIIIGIPFIATSNYLIAYFLGQNPTPFSELNKECQAGVLKMVVFISMAIFYGIMQCFNNVMNSYKKVWISALNAFISLILFRWLYVFLFQFDYSHYNYLDYVMLLMSIPFAWVLSSIISIIFWIFIKSNLYKDVIHIFVSKDVSKYSLKEIINKLPDETKQYVNTFKHAKQRKLCAMGYYLLQTKLEYFDFGKSIPHIIRNKYGKPCFANRKMYFNLSHSHNVAVCAIAKDNVGVDIQQIQKYDESIAKLVFHINEIQEIQKSKNQNLSFTSIWSKKEAYLKLKGYGLNKNMKNINTLLIDIKQYVKKDYVISCIGKDMKNKIVKIHYHI